MGHGFCLSVSVIIFVSPNQWAQHVLGEQNQHYASHETEDGIKARPSFPGHVSLFMDHQINGEEQHADGEKAAQQQDQIVTVVPDVFGVFCHDNDVSF